MPLGRPRPAAGLAIVLLTASALGAGGEIYRYQDPQGVWQFTDDPPPNVGAEPVPDITWGRPPPAATADLTTQLEEGFDGVTPIARATLAVVTVKSGFAVGSGFFCSPEGHILTNRHVVRPSEDDRFAEQERSVDDRAEDAGELQQQVDEGRRQLAMIEKDLAGYQRVIRGTANAAARSWAEQAHADLSERYGQAKAEGEAMAARLGTLQRAVSQQRRDLDWTRTSAAVASSFDVVLRDGTELQARLVDISATRDLALLKVDGFRTPYLRLDSPPPLSEGQHVFAIGNPLGMQAAISAGSVTRVDLDLVHTDATLPPENSGGPLITDDGELVGISLASAGTTASPGENGASAIPSVAAIQDFPQIPRTAGDTPAPSP